MAIKNSFSKTYFKVTKDRLQHYSQDQYSCDDCGHHYHPMIHSKSYLVQCIAVIIGLLLYFTLEKLAPPWQDQFYTILPLLLIAFFLWSRHRRRVTTPDGPKKIRYGNIVLSCPACQSIQSTKVT